MLPKNLRDFPIKLRDADHQSSQLRYQCRDHQRAVLQDGRVLRQRLSLLNVQQLLLQIDAGPRVASIETENLSSAAVLQCLQSWPLLQKITGPCRIQLAYRG